MIVQINLITLEAYYCQFIYVFRWWSWCVDQVKRYVWRVKMFHKTVHKAWNVFNLSEQSPENSVENPVSRLSIDRMLFLIDRTRIK